MEKNINELFKEKLEDIIKNKAYAFNKKSLEKIKKEVNFYKIKSTSNNVSYDSRNPIKGVIMLLAGGMAMGMSTFLGGSFVSEQEALPIFKEFSSLFSLIIGFSGIIFSFFCFLFPFR